MKKRFCQILLKLMDLSRTKFFYQLESNQNVKCVFFVLIPFEVLIIKFEKILKIIAINGKNGKLKWKRFMPPLIWQEAEKKVKI